VKKVLRNYEEYKRIYDKTSLTTSLAPAGPEKDIGSMASGVEVTKP
jgi:hypothetical protein